LSQHRVSVVYSQQPHVSTVTHISLKRLYLR